MQKLKSFVVSICFLLSAISAHSSGRESGGGGGNGCVAEFHSLAEGVLSSVLAHEFEIRLPAGFSVLLLRQAVETMTVTGTHSKLFVEGMNVTAINFPEANKIELNVEDWNQLQLEAKKQLVIHELLGLRFRSIVDDANYSYSTSLLKIFDTFTIESAALAMAQAGDPHAGMMKILVSRTKQISFSETGLGTVTVTEVAIQTFERESADSVRVYRIESNDLGGVLSAKLDHYEGKAGPYFGPF